MWLGKKMIKTKFSAWPKKRSATFKNVKKIKTPI